jgi:peptidoglycan/xylan/chitin deacetylase (PgdA/CDA1 family)
VAGWLDRIGRRWLARRRSRLVRPDTERARLARLTRFGIVVTIVAVLVDVVGGRAPDQPIRATASPPPATTTQPPLPVDRAPVITRVETTDPVVFLTIDDGHTRSPEGLAAFRAAGVPASLFLLDGPIRKDAAYFHEMPRTVVEAHTRTHPDLRALPEQAQRQEICGNADTIEQSFGRRPVLFRPPYGVYNEATQHAAAACGMRLIVLWEQTVSREQIGFRHEHEFRPGDIILMHFGPTFVEELRVITERVEAAGLRFALLEDYLVPESVGEPARTR